MVDNSKDGLMQSIKKPSLSSSFYPISEKDEISVASNFQNNIAPLKTMKSKKSIKLVQDNSITKNVLDDGDLIKHSRTQKNKKSWIFQNNNKESFFKIKVEKNQEEEEVNKLSFPKSPQYKKRLTKINSYQEKGNILLFNMSILNNSELKEKQKKGSIGKGQQLLGSFNNSHLLQKNSINYQDNSLAKRNSKSKSLSNIVDFTKINRKRTLLQKGKLTYNEKTAMSIYDQIKNSESYEKSEKLLFKLKICFAILAVFSLVSIILNCADSLLYNNKSIEYIINENNNTFFDKNNIDNYYVIKKRIISPKENTIRIFNGIFSLFCIIIIIIIYKIKTGVFISTDDTKKEKFKKMLNIYYNKNRRKPLATQKTMQEKERNEKIQIHDVKLEYKKTNDNEKKNIIERNITIRLCVANIIFYPPYINVAFIGKYHNIIYIYSLNSLFLILSIFKLSNIYKAVFYLSSLNNTFNNAICKSNLINLNFSFMIKYKMNRTPLIFILFNLILLFLITCIIIFCVEYFSLDISNDFWSNVNENKGENYLNILNCFFFFSIRNIHEEHSIKSFLGKIILYFGGLFGMLLSSFFLFYMNNLVELSPEEHVAYSKLTKLLNPENKEHKASNLIKSILLIKKIYIDNKNTVRDYKLKNIKEEKPKITRRKSVFQKDNAFNLVFNLNGTDINVNEINDNKEKKKFIKYIGYVFVFKAKIKVELKNFIDKSKVARNSTLSFNDVLKTICTKLDINNGQLNNKIEILIKKEQKYLDFIKFTSNTIRKIEKISHYQTSLIQYFSEIHNEHVKQIIEIRKEADQVSPILYKNSINFPKRMKSNIFGGLNFKSKAMKNIPFATKKNSKKKKPMYDFGISNFTLKKQKSSHISSSFLQSNILKQASSKKCMDKIIKPKMRNSTVDKRTKTLDEWNFIQDELKELKQKMKERQSMFNNTRSVSALNNQNKDNKNIK